MFLWREVKRGMGTWCGSFVSCGDNKSNIFVTGKDLPAREKLQEPEGGGDLLSEILRKGS